MSSTEQTTRKGGDRSKFSHTCNLLSKYIKEKGTIRDLAIDMMAPRPPLPDLKGKSEANPTALPDLNATTTVDAKGPSTAAPQLTIFYAGKVMVFDDFPEVKAKELVAMASEGVSRAPTTQTCPPPASTSGADKALAERPTPQHAPPSSADLPIARRISLNRFLEKRKDRISSKAPYQVQDMQHGASSLDKPQSNEEDDGGKWWLGLAPSASAPSSSSDHLQ